MPPSASPFDAVQAALNAILTGDLGLSPGGVNPFKVIAWPPDSKFGPVPSSRLLHDMEKAEAYCVCALGVFHPDCLMPGKP